MFLPQSPLLTRTVTKVIHFVSDIDQAKAEMATIMAGGEPPQDPGHVSSHNFAQLPRHVVFGKGFQWPKLQEVRESAGNDESGLCWYWAPLAPGEIPIKAADVPNITDETLHMQTDKIVANMKRCLGEVIRDGKEGRDGVYSLAPPAPAPVAA